MTEPSSTYNPREIENMPAMLAEFGRITIARPFESLDRVPITIDWGDQPRPEGSVMLVGFEKGAFWLVHRSKRGNPWSITALVPSRDQTP